MTPAKNQPAPTSKRTSDRSERVAGSGRVPSKQRAAGQAARSYTVSVLGDIPPDLADRVAHAHAKAMLAGGFPDRASRATKKEAKSG